MAIITSAVHNTATAGNNELKKRPQPFKQYVNDPLKVKQYVLSNGLTLIVSPNKNEPRIQTMIAVKAGSKNDPSSATGLAHYLEHMMFKGTSSFGTQNWKQEKEYLDKIEELYEQHRNEKDEAKKKLIYAKIDSVSHIASGLAIPNEYDKMISSLGAKGTNAYTSVEQTVYINDIPSNEFDKWLMIESERFRQVVLRLFHTELEAVYEEFNIGQDNDDRKIYKGLMESLFPNHTYGTQTTIGTGEHLKNPSMTEIYKYFKTYYVPNNMAIVLSGDIDPDYAFERVKAFWSDYERKPVPEFKVNSQPEISTVMRKEVFGKQKAVCEIGFRTAGSGTRDAMLADLVGTILSNGQAGLMDLNILQKQTALEAGAGVFVMKDFGVLNLYGTPREGQKPEDVEKLLLEELENVKKGNFSDWLISAIAKNGKLMQMRQFERNNVRANLLVRAFTQDLDWQKVINYYDEMAQITKQEVMDFATKNYTNNYVVLYKREGEDKEVYKVEKPSITANKIVRDVQSDFLVEFNATKSNAVEPEFVDFENKIQHKQLSKEVRLDYIHNEDNTLFDLFYIVDMGTDNDRELGLALKYLPYLGTNKYTPEALKQEFYKLGVNMDVSSSRDQVYVVLSGLNESFPQALQLFEHVLANAKADNEILKNVLSDIQKEREDAKKDKGVILRQAMLNYAMFGSKNPFNNVLTNDELSKIKGESLVAKVKNITKYPHKIFYYGPQALDATYTQIKKQHKLPKTFAVIPSAIEYQEQATETNKVLFTDFDMVQAEILMISKGTAYEKPQHVFATLYNDYFGSGLSSIVFQEIRESKALAYSAAATYSTPSKKTESHYYRAYVGTQVDKMADAIKAMNEIVDNMPVSDNQIYAAIDAVKKRIQSERITGKNIYFTYLRNKKLGLENDVRQDIYQLLIQDNSAVKRNLVDFQKQYVKGRRYTTLVLGDKDKVNFTFLNTIGKVSQPTLAELFGY